MSAMEKHEDSKLKYNKYKVMLSRQSILDGARAKPVVCQCFFFFFLALSVYPLPPLKRLFCFTTVVIVFTKDEPVRIRPLHIYFEGLRGSSKEEFLLLAPKSYFHTKMRQVALALNGSRGYVCDEKTPLKR